MSSTVAFTKPDLYDTSNLIHLRDSKQALDKYSHWLRWKEGERVVDVGSGSGNVTTQILAARLPADYKLLVGFDISDYMVRYAAENNNDPRITFVQGDIIEPDLKTLKGFFEKENISIGFDKIFSFHCIHWVANSAQWSKNMYSLLRPGGQTFIMTATYACVTDVFIEAAFSEKWLTYTKVVEPYRSEFHYSTDIDGDLTKVMTNAGFVVECCEHYDCYFDPQWSDSVISRLFQSADPYVHTIPENLHSDYFEDLNRTLKKYQQKYSEKGMPYSTSIVVASKPEN